ncbi:MAG: ATP synthase F1 subunit delta [Chitinophagales bacterium]|nr:F0F1 ATP synthase subunit delta [Bacteroidota bacterium]
MSAEKLGTRYAKALFNEATEKASLDAVYADLNSIDNALNASKELQNVFKSPIIKNYKKEAIAQQLFDGKVSAITANFLKLIINQNRDAYLRDIMRAFFKLYNETKGISEVTVTTAVPLEKESENKIVEFIKKTSGYPNVKINQKIDASILGGFIVDFGNKLYDNSVRYKLNKIKKEISIN